MSKQPLIENLEYLRETKEVIKEAIRNKGVEVSDEDTFRSYSDKIASIAGSPNLEELKEVNPSTSSQSILPSEGFEGMKQVIVNPVTPAIDSNIKAENIKKDISILGINGTFEGENSGGTGSEGIYKVSSLEERDAIEAKPGDMCVVISGGVRNMTANDTPRKIIFPVKVVLPEAVTGSISAGISCGSTQGDIFLTKTRMDVMMFGDIKYSIYYSSTDGITYYGDYDVSGEALDFGDEVVISGFNDVLGYFMQVDETDFKGIFKYDKFMYNEFPTSSGETVKIPAHQFEGFTTSCDVLVYEYSVDNTGIVDFYHGLLFYPMNHSSSMIDSSSNYFYIDDNNNLYFRCTDTSSTVEHDINGVVYNSTGLHRYYTTGRGSFDVGDNLIAENIDPTKIFITPNEYYEYELNIYNKDRSRIIYTAPKTWTDVEEYMWTNAALGLDSSTFNITTGNKALINKGVVTGEGFEPSLSGISTAATMLDSWKTDKFYKSTTGYYSIFSNCEAVNPKTYEAILLVLGWKESYFSRVFDGCKCSGSLDLSYCLDISTATTADNTFLNCLDIKKIILPKAMNSTITRFVSTFTGCSKLEEIDMKYINNGADTNTSQMFSGCTSLKLIDMRSFNFSNVKTYTNMFKDVPNNCLIVVANSTYKSWITSKFSNLTNVKTVAEYGN